MSKVCPLRVLYGISAVCREDQCAWWDEEQGHCIIMTCLSRLEGIDDSLDLLQSKAR